jgi:hypothetical protein
MDDGVSRGVESTSFSEVSGSVEVIPASDEVTIIGIKVVLATWSLASDELVQIIPKSD